MPEISRTGSLVWAARLVTLALGVRAAVLCALYMTGAAGTERHDVESAVAALILVGALVSAFAADASPLPTRATTAFRGEWVAWCVASLVLYWPSLRVGLLSDDFVLAARARQAQFGIVHSELFRPLPLVAWFGLLRLQLGAGSLHALNVVSHGLVAFVASSLAAWNGGSKVWAIMAGLLVLTFPAAVEAVTWNSGVFDVTATLLVLLCVLVARRYGTQPHWRTRAAMLFCAIAALLCKETAIVAPALVALDAWASKRWPRALAIDLAGLTALFAAVGTVRLLLASDMVRQPLSKYMVQRWLFGTVGGVAVPWHVRIAETSPWLPLTGALLAIGIAVVFFTTRKTVETTRVAGAAAGWLVLGSLPTLPFFFVAPDLQGARYLYLPAVGYALLLVAMSRAGNVAARAFGIAAIVWLIVAGAVGARAHQQFWLGAAAARDGVLDEARRDIRLHACTTASVRGLPDAFEGAYVLRNGADIALSEVGVATAGTPPALCSFKWDQARAAFVVAQ